VGFEISRSAQPRPFRLTNLPRDDNACNASRAQ
jgi:hypothetical protein